MNIESIGFLKNHNGAVCPSMEINFIELCISIIVYSGTTVTVYPACRTACQTREIHYTINEI